MRVELGERLRESEGGAGEGAESEGGAGGEAERE